MDIINHPVTQGLPDLSVVNEVLDTLTLEARNRDVQPMDRDLFLPSNDHQALQDAYLWWPKDAPANLSWAHCFGGSLAMYGTAVNTESLVTHLTRQTNRVVTWLGLEGRDTQYPNESKSERRARLNRERVSRHRDNARATEPTPAKVAWDKVVEARRQRAEARGNWDTKVRQAHEAMMAIVGDRATAMAHWDKEVVVAEEAHRQVTKG